MPIKLQDASYAGSKCKNGHVCSGIEGASERSFAKSEPLGRVGGLALVIESHSTMDDDIQDGEFRCTSCKEIHPEDDAIVCTDCNGVDMCESCAAHEMYVLKEGDTSKDEYNCDTLCENCFRDTVANTSHSDLANWYIHQVGVDPEELRACYKRWLLGEERPILPKPKRGGKRDASDAQLDETEVKAVKVDYLGTIVE